VLARSLSASVRNPIERVVNFLWDSSTFLHKGICKREEKVKLTLSFEHRLWLFFLKEATKQQRVDLGGD
jgi:hypothetical protein